MAQRLVVKEPLTVSTTALLLLPANNARIGLMIQEIGGQAARFDNHSDVSTSRGLTLLANALLQFQGSVCTTDAIWIIRDGGSDATVVVAEIVTSG